MSFFSRKKEIKVDDFFRNIYDGVLNPIEGIDLNDAYFNTIRKSLIEADPSLSRISAEDLNKAMTPLRFEIFSLAWMHRFTGKHTLAQSLFTKKYLHEKSQDTIWEAMEHYNNYVDSAVLNWLTSLGKMNLSFWYHMREDLTKKNVEEAEQMGITDQGVIDRVNKRLCSETAWKQQLVLKALLLALCKKLNIEPEELNEKAVLTLAGAIKGLYDGAYQASEDIKVQT